MKAFATILAIIIANYVYAYFNIEVDYDVALERSYFSTLGVLVYALNLKLFKHGY